MSVRTLPVFFILWSLACSSPARKAAEEPAPAASRAAVTPPSELPTRTLEEYPIRIQRLAHVGRLFGAVLFRHPHLAYGNIDWDSAVLQAIPRVAAASDSDDYIAAVRDMLRALGDPLTVVARDKPAADGASVPLSTRMLEDAILVVDLGTANSRQHIQDASKVLAELPRSKAVIFDLRHAGEQGASYMSMIFDSLNPHLVATEVALPALRTVSHSGYRPQSFSSSGRYHSKLTVAFAERVAPEAGARERRVVFLLGRVHALPAIAMPLRETGQAAFIADRRIDDYAFSYTDNLSLGEGWHAEVRTSEAVYKGRAIDFAPDALMDTGGDDQSPAMQKAIELAKLAVAPRPQKAGGAVMAVWRRDKTYPDLERVGRAHRVLAAYRIWNIMHYFYPYLHLLGDWDPVLPMAVATLDAADGEHEYTRAVAQVAALIADDHTFLRGERLKKAFPSAPAPLSARMIGGKAVVDWILHPPLTPGLEKGDVIETVDGRPIAERMADIRPYVPGSHDVGRQSKTLSRALNGDEGAPLRLGVRGADNQLRVIESTYGRAHFKKYYKRDADQGPSYKTLDAGDGKTFGYVDLRVIAVPEVDAMFDALKDTEAIIFDMRGYPKGTAWSIGPRLQQAPGTVYAALFERSVIDSGEPSRITFKQPLPKNHGKWIYRKPTYMLIDHQAISQAEHTGLFFEAANGTQFIGTETAGANGDVTNLCLPGDLCLYFTGHDVRHADGRQLQRVGLTPHVRVSPTIAGIRAGKDEVLDRAVEYAREQMQAGARPATAQGSR